MNSDDSDDDFVLIDDNLNEQYVKAKDTKLTKPCAVPIQEEKNETQICTDKKRTTPDENAPENVSQHEKAAAEENTILLQTEEQLNPEEYDLEDDGLWGGADEDDFGWSDDGDNPDDMDIPFAIPKISCEFLDSEETLNQNREWQKDELDSLQSIFEDDYGEIGVHQDACVIRISCGRYEVRLMVDMPKTYPSLDPPIPTIIGAWWPEFDLEEMNERLLSSFVRETICIYDWTTILSDHLQEMMDNVVEKHKKRIEHKDDFPGQLAGLVLDLEKGLAFQDLVDEENYTDRFSRVEHDYIFKCVRNCLKKKKNRTKKILKRIHKKIPSFIAKHLYWVLKLYEEYETVPIDKAGRSSFKYRNLENEYKIEEIAKESNTHILVDKANYKIQIFGPKVSRQEAAAAIIGHNAVKILMGLLAYRQVKNYKVHDLDVGFYPQHKILATHRKFLCQCKSKEFYQTHYSTQQLLSIISALKHYVSVYSFISHRRAARQIQTPYRYSSAATFDLQWGSLGHEAPRSNTSQVRIRLDSPFKNGYTVFHGTKACNVLSIMHRGLLINGGQARPANGAAYGRGIYTADSLNIPLGYAAHQPAMINGSKWLCVFQCSCSNSKPVVGSSIHVIENEKEIRVTQLILCRTS